MFFLKLRISVRCLGRWHAFFKKCPRDCISAHLLLHYNSKNVNNNIVCFKCNLPGHNPVNVLFNKTICSSLNDNDCYNATLNNYTYAQIRSASSALQIPSNITSLDSTFIPSSPLESQKTKNTLKLLHISAQSLLPKIPEPRLLVEESKYDCISVSETWMNSSFSESELNIPGFKIFRNDRKDKPHGGVAIYARSSLSPILISATFKTEIISVKVKLKSKSILIVSLLQTSPSMCRLF